VNRKRDYYQLVPRKELKCVWMTAGMLTYKLCKYDLQCERCPLDWELRNISPSPTFDLTASREGKSIDSGGAGLPLGEKDRPGEEFLGEDLFRSDIKGSFFYHPGHTWIKVEKADEVRVGLDCFIGRMIGKVNVIVLPLSGTRCRRGENLCSIIQEEGILNIVFPLSGSVLSVNQTLEDQPDLISKDPMGDGFLLTLKPKNLQRDQPYLFSGESALSWYRKELERFKATMISEFNGQERIGMTMQDGGIKLGDIKKIVAPERYTRLVGAFLRDGEKDLQLSKHESMEHSKPRLG